ncbi:unnamed protein product, partial [Heterosigma akashiwo]
MDFHRTLLGFGTYVLVMGTLLLLVPGQMIPMLNFLVGSFGLATFSQSVYESPPAKLLFVVIVCLGYYYIQAGIDRNRQFAEMSVKGRILFAAIVVLLTMNGSVENGFILFGAIDVAGAGWTKMALRNS